MSRPLEEVLKRAQEPVKALPTKAEEHASKRSRPDTAGPAWFNMPAAERTPELQAELRALRLRAAIDPKRHYRSGEKPADTPYIQVGTVIDDPSDFYSADTHRTSRRAKKRSLVDTLLRDEQARQYYRARFTQLQQRASSGSHKAYQEQRNRLRKPWTRASRPVRR